MTHKQMAATLKKVLLESGVLWGNTRTKLKVVIKALEAEPLAEGYVLPAAIANYREGKGRAFTVFSASISTDNGMRVVIYGEEK